jgi:hypothetical protein
MSAPRLHTPESLMRETMQQVGLLLELQPGLPLVVLGRNNPSLYAFNGRPVYVHLNGLAIVRLK